MPPSLYLAILPALQHHFPHHPECPERVLAIQHTLENAALATGQVGSTTAAAAAEAGGGSLLLDLPSLASSSPPYNNTADETSRA